jgi:hypothetical protein
MRKSSCRRCSNQRRLALISVRLPDREIGSTDFNDGLDGRVLGAEQLNAALDADLCQKVPEVS